MSTVPCLSVSVTNKETVYVLQSCIVVRKRNHCCHGNVTIRSIFVVGVDVAVSSVECSVFPWKLNSGLPLHVMSSYRIFLTAVSDAR